MSNYYYSGQYRDWVRTTGTSDQPASTPVVVPGGMVYPDTTPTDARCEYCFHSREPQSLSREHDLTADTNGKPVVHGLACKVCLADYWRDRAQAAQLEMAKAIQELRASTERLTDAYQKAIEVLS